MTLLLIPPDVSFFFGSGQGAGQEINTYGVATARARINSGDGLSDVIRSFLKTLLPREGFLRVRAWNEWATGLFVLCMSR